MTLLNNALTKVTLHCFAMIALAAKNFLKIFSLRDDSIVNAYSQT
jgi:hypothetical protein